MNQNKNKNNNHLLSTPLSTSLENSSTLRKHSHSPPNQNNTFRNYLRSNSHNNNPMNSLKDFHQYPYTYNSPYDSIDEKERFSLHYNRSEKAYSIQPEEDLELKKQISDSFFYKYAPFMNINYVPLSSSFNSNSKPNQLLEKKRLREFKSNNSPLSTDIYNSNNSKGEVMCPNTIKDLNQIMTNGILDNQPIPSAILPKPIVKKNKANSSNTQLTLLSSSNILPGVNNKNNALIKPIGKNNRKRGNHPLTALDLYSDEEYNSDLYSLLQNNKKHQFMFENFPNAYSKSEFFNNIRKLKEKRRLRTIFIEPSSLKEETIFISNPIKYECYNIKTLKKIWSPNKNMNDNDYRVFYNKMEQKWPFYICQCAIEPVLEYLMMKDYSQDNCLKDLNDCVTFVNERVLKISIEDNDVYNKDTIRSQREKKYNLRNRSLVNH